MGMEMMVVEGDEVPDIMQEGRMAQELPLLPAHDMQSLPL